MCKDDIQKGDSSSGFERLIQRVANGEEEAAWDLVQEYGPHILRAVRRNLHARVRQQFDSVDFAQAVWASLFVAKKRLTQLHSPEELIALLTTITRNKVIDAVRQRTTTKKYDVRREVSADREGAGLVASIASKDPTPSEFAIARERWEQLMADQPDHYRRIIALRLQGQSHKEIASALDISDKTVQRVLTRLIKERVA